MFIDLGYTQGSESREGRPKGVDGQMPGPQMAFYPVGDREPWVREGMMWAHLPLVKSPLGSVPPVMDESVCLVTSSRTAARREGFQLTFLGLGPSLDTTIATLPTERMTYTAILKTSWPEKRIPVTPGRGPRFMASAFTGVGDPTLPG